MFYDSNFINGGEFDRTGIYRGDLYGDYSGSGSFTANDFSYPTYTAPVAASDPYEDYARSNPDLMAEYGRVAGQFGSMGNYGRFHYNSFGLREGRQLPGMQAPSPAEPVANPFIDLVPTDTNTPAPAPVAPTLTDIIRQTPGYQFQTQEGLKAINSNAYARGMGDSGATAKALVDYGRNAADSYYNTYLANVSNVASQGQGSAANLAGQSNAFTNAANGISQNQANAISNNAMFQGQQTANMWNGIAGAVGGIAGSGIFGSSARR